MRCENIHLQMHLTISNKTSSTATTTANTFLMAITIISTKLIMHKCWCKGNLMQQKRLQVLKERFSLEEIVGEITDEFEEDENMINQITL